MRKFKLFGLELISWGDDSPLAKVEKPQPVDVKILPPRRQSTPSHDVDIALGIRNDSKVLIPSAFREFIPQIRSLAYTNQDMSQALNNIIELGNTGHKIKFDASVSPEQQIKMRAHLDLKKEEWGDATAGMDGLVNKMFAQIMISGSLSNEWLVNFKLTGLKGCALVNPETIYFSYNNKKEIYEVYQQSNNILLKGSPHDNLKKLNQKTYKYYALNGDTDSPYGIPPYFPAIDAIANQIFMLDNIKFIIEQIGVMGFLEVTLDKPERQADESHDKYVDRLNSFLQEAKSRVQEGFRDGIAVGFEEDTKFEFHATGRNFDGVDKMFQLNETNLASGLKTDPGMMGRNYGSSETQITIIFTKLLSQLKNIQRLVKCNLEYGYSLELRLAGYRFNNLTVEFNASTALDELKDAQAQEIKVRNNNALYLDGIISQEQYARNMGYEKASESKPRFIRGAVQTEAEAKQKTEKKKDASDKKVRSKNKPQEKSSK